MVLSGQTLSSQGAYQLEIIRALCETGADDVRPPQLATADWSLGGTFHKEALVCLWHLLQGSYGSIPNIRDNLERHFLPKTRPKLFITDCGLVHHVYFILAS